MASIWPLSRAGHSFGVDGLDDPLVGDGAGFVNMEKIKGIHYGILSGMAAADTVAEGLAAAGSGPAADGPVKVSGYVGRLEERGVLPAMRHARNYRAAFRWGIYPGAPLSLVQSRLVELLIAESVEQYGRIDILVNNAGIGGGGRLAVTATESFHEVMKTNLYGTFFCCRAGFTQMKEQGGGLSSTCRAWPACRPGQERGPTAPPSTASWR